MVRFHFVIFFGPKINKFAREREAELERWKNIGRWGPLDGERKKKIQILNIKIHFYRENKMESRCLTSYSLLDTYIYINFLIFLNFFVAIQNFNLI